MTNQENNEELRASRINRYLGLEGEITPEECDQFEADLESDPELREDYLITINMLRLAIHSKEEEVDVDDLPHTDGGQLIYEELKTLLRDNTSKTEESEQQERDYTSLVNRYLGLEGEITPEECDQFEADLETNMDLRAEYLLTVNMLKLSDSSKEVLDEDEVVDDLPHSENAERIYQELKGWLAESKQVEVEKDNQVSMKLDIEQDQVGSSSNTITHPAAEANEPVAMRSSRTIFSPRFTYWLSGIAAVLVIGFFIGKSLWGGPEYHFEDWTPEDMAAIRGGADESIKILLKQADYAKARDEIEEEMKDLDQEKKSLESNSERTDEENDRLVQIIAQQEQLLWLKGNALLGLDQAKDVVDILEQMKKAESPYCARMDSLYNVFK